MGAICGICGGSGTLGWGSLRCRSPESETGLFKTLLVILIPLAARWRPQTNGNPNLKPKTPVHKLSEALALQGVLDGRVGEVWQSLGVYIPGGQWGYRAFRDKVDKMETTI